MRRRSTVMEAAAAASAVALALAASASAATVTGVVAHDNASAHSFVIATGTGKLVAVHAGHLPRVGRLAKVSARPLRNGTFSAVRVRVGRKTGHVRLRGTVTYSSARHHEFVVSARGVSLLVHQHRARDQSAFSAVAPPAIGTAVTVDGRTSDDGIDASSIDEAGTNLNGFDLEGNIEAINATTRTLTLSADDSEQSGATLTIQVPSTFDMTNFQVGQQTELIVSPNPDGTYTLEQSSNDSSGRHADNPHEIQGDDHGDQHRNAEQQCVTQSSDSTFASAHAGMTFVQFYDPTDLRADDALKNCADAISGEHSGGSDGSGASSSSGGSGKSGQDSNSSNGTSDSSGS
jgi:uncharacterized membrane protein YgcG